jgi:hypothetical protein
MGSKEVRDHGSYDPLGGQKRAKEKETPAWSTIQKDVVVFVEEGSQGGHEPPLRAYFAGQHLKRSGYSGMSWKAVHVSRSRENGFFGGDVAKEHVADMGTRGKAALEEHPG